MLGSADKDRLQWSQWIPPDNGRAEVPLDRNSDERW